MPAAAKLFVIAAPSGAGKTTLVRALLERNPELEFSVSYTTRQKRATEIEGRDYFFVQPDELLRLNECGELLESAQVFDNHYGTSRSQVERHLSGGRHVVLEIDWQGAQQVRASMPECVTIFLLPPSRQELERRLRDRRTDTAEVIERRLRDAFDDMSHWQEFDYAIINDDLLEAVVCLEAVIHGSGDESQSGNPALQARIAAIISA